MKTSLLMVGLAALSMTDLRAQERSGPVARVGAARRAVSGPAAPGAPGSTRNPCLQFGVSLGYLPLLNDPAYASIVEHWREISSFTIETAHKFKFTRFGPGPNDYDFSVADEIIARVQAYGYGRGGMAFHTLFWHHRFQLDPWVEALGFQGTRTVIQEHLDAVYEHYFVGPAAYPINRVDVVNEAMGDNRRMRPPGSHPENNPWAQAGTSGLGYADWAAFAFERAQATFPETTPLYYNDYGIGIGPIDTDPSHAYDPTGATHISKADAVYKLVRDHLKPAGLDGVGFQMHLIIPYYQNISRLRTNIRLYADIGVDVHITELDIPIDTGGIPPTAAQLQRQADLFEEIVQTCAEEPNCTQVTVWGVTDLHSWIPSFATHCPGCVGPLPHDDLGQPKPAYDAINRVFDLVQRACPR